MTLKERMAAAKSKLEEVKAAVEKGEKTAEDLNEAITAVKDIQKQMDAASEAEILMKQLSGGEKEKDAKGDASKEEPRTLGEFVAAKVKESGIDAKVKFNFAAPAFKAAAPMVIPSSVKPAITNYDTNVVGTRRPLMIADLFSTERISGNALTFFVESSTIEGSPSTTTEGQKKPMVSFGDPTAKTVSLSKIASHMKESDELVEDAPWLADAINNRGIYLHQLEVEDFLVSELGATSGIGTGSSLTPDGIFNAMMTVQTNSGFAADAIVINPSDYANIRLRKDSNGQYYGGGFMNAPYGNGEVIEMPAIWGLRTVVSSAVTAGTAYVGAFKAGGSIVRKSNGVVVDIANMNEDDFVKNLITILIEERLALAVRHPAAFVKITGSSTSTEP